MKKTRKTIYVKAYTREDFEKEQQAKPRRTAWLGVDFSAIEENPQTDVQRAAVGKITVQPEALELLVEEEKKALFKKAMQEVEFTDSERKCIEMNLEGLGLTEISQTLKISIAAVRVYQSRAIAKIRRYVSAYYRPPKNSRSKKD